MFQETSSLPGPAKKRWDGTGACHDPGERTTYWSMSGSEFEAAHGFADHNVPLDSQNNQRPQSDLTCGEKQTSKPVASPQEFPKVCWEQDHSWDYPSLPPRVAMNPSMVQLIRPKAKYPIMQE